MMEGTPKEGEEENKGRPAVPEERDEQNMPHQRASTVNDQMTEETRNGIRREPPHGLRPQTMPGTQTQSLKMPNDSQPGNVPQRPRPAPRTETGLPAQELAGSDVENQLQGPQMENGVQVPQMENKLNISFGAIAFSTTLFGVYHSLDSNNLTSDQMVLHEVSIWLLYLSLFFGGLMLTISLSPPFTHNLSIFYWLLRLAFGAGYYAVGFETYLRLPKSTIRLIMIFVLPTAVVLVAMILKFKDKIVRLFPSKQHPNYTSIQS